jgi:hypothetical protein
MASYTYTPLALSNVTHRGRHEHRPGLRDGISYMFEHYDAQRRVPPNYEDLVSEASGLSGFMVDIYGLQKFTDLLIRLLILEPSPSTAPICCRLEHCDLREEPQFEALSYFWGPPVDTPDMHEITCSERKVLVGPNLYLALRALRYPDRERVLWVDALCINQVDKAEVNTQVKMMGHIYSCAERVLVWLGVEHEQDSSAIEAIQETVKLLNELVETSEETVERFTKTLLNNPKLPPNGWQHIGNLFSRPYFKRLWVIQEVVNSTSAEVLYGDQTIKWDDMIKIVYLNSLLSFCTPETKRSFHLSSLEESNVLIINDLLHSRKNNKPGRPLFDILFHTHRFQATNVRDKVFSILNLPRFEGEWIPIPKYELSPFEVFRDFAIIDLTRNNSLKILSWVNTAGVERSPNDTSPSWVPNVDDFQGPAPSFFMECGRTPITLDNTKEIAWINDDKTLLKIQGRLLPEPIKYLSKARSSCYAESEAKFPFRVADFTDSILNIERRWFKSCFNIFLWAKESSVAEEINTRNAEKDPPSQGGILALGEIASSDVYRRFLLTMCRNWTPYNRSTPSPVILNNTMCVTEALIAGYDLEEVFGGAKDAFLIVYKETICQEHTKWKRIAALADGRIGWVPKNARGGDRVCVFKGGRESFLLREIKGEAGASGNYKLLGECYFEGLENNAVGSEGGEDYEVVELKIM